MNRLRAAIAGLLVATSLLTPISESAVPQALRAQTPCREFFTQQALTPSLLHFHIAIFVATQIDVWLPLIANLDASIPSIPPEMNGLWLAAFLPPGVPFHETLPKDYGLIPIPDSVIVKFHRTAIRRQTRRGHFLSFLQARITDTDGLNSDDPQEALFWELLRRLNDKNTPIFIYDESREPARKVQQAAPITEGGTYVLAYPPSEEPARETRVETTQFRIPLPAAPTTKSPSGWVNDPSSPYDRQRITVQRTLETKRGTKVEGRLPDGKKRLFDLAQISDREPPPPDDPPTPTPPPETATSPSLVPPPITPPSHSMTVGEVLSHELVVGLRGRIVHLTGNTIEIEVYGHDGASMMTQRLHYPDDMKGWSSSRPGQALAIIGETFKGFSRHFLRDIRRYGLIQAAIRRILQSISDHQAQETESARKLDQALGESLPPGQWNDGKIFSWSEPDFLTPDGHGVFGLLIYRTGERGPLFWIQSHTLNALQKNPAMTMRIACYEAVEWAISHSVERPRDPDDAASEAMRSFPDVSRFLGVDPGPTSPPKSGTLPAASDVPEFLFPLIDLRRSTFLNIQETDDLIRRINAGDGLKKIVRWAILKARTAVDNPTGQNALAALGIDPQNVDFIEAFFRRFLPLDLSNDCCTLLNRAGFTVLLPNDQDDDALIATVALHIEIELLLRTFSLFQDAVIRVGMFTHRAPRGANKKLGFRYSYDTGAISSLRTNIFAQIKASAWLMSGIRQIFTRSNQAAPSISGPRRSNNNLPNIWVEHGITSPKVTVPSEEIMDPRQFFENVLLHYFDLREAVLIAIKAVPLTFNGTIRSAIRIVQKRLSGALLDDDEQVAFDNWFAKLKASPLIRSPYLRDSDIQAALRSLSQSHFEPRSFFSDLWNHIKVTFEYRSSDGPKLLRQIAFATRSPRPSIRLALCRFLIEEMKSRPVTEAHPTATAA